MTGLAFLAAVQTTTKAQLAVGQRSEDVAFALFESGNALANARLSDFVGKVVTIVYFTPW